MIPMTLTVPAKRDWCLVLRMAASGVGAVYDLPVDILEDLSTAIDESCELLSHQDFKARSFTMTCQAKPDGLHLSLTVQPCEGDNCKEEAADADIASLIIGTLVREVSLERDAQGVKGVHMTLPAKE